MNYVLFLSICIFSLSILYCTFIGYKIVFDYFQKYFTENPCGYDDTFHTTSSNAGDVIADHPILANLIFVKLVTALHEKYDITLEKEELGVYLLAFNSLDKNDYTQICDYVKKHPFISVFLIDKFTELYYNKKIKNEHITVVDILPFIYVAKTLT